MGCAEQELHPLLLPPLPSSASAYLPLLQSCFRHKHKASPRVHQILHHLLLHRIPLHGVLGDHLVVALAKCGDLPRALLLSSRLPCLSVFSWTALIVAHNDLGLAREALRIFGDMQEVGVLPNGYTFVSLFKACGNVGDLEMGMRFHALQVATQGAASNGFVGNALVSMYGKCGALEEAEHVFCTLTDCDLVSWNAMLSAYVEMGLAEDALHLYVQMQREDVAPDRPTFVSVLHACAIFAETEGSVPVKKRSLKIALALHVDVINYGFAFNVFVNSSLVRLYGKCGEITEAVSVFSALTHHDLVCCTAMLSAYVEQDNDGGTALQFYRQMCEEDIQPDQVATVFALRACGSFSHRSSEGDFMMNIPLEVGRALHSKARKMGFASDILVSNAFLSLYCRCQAIDEAEGVFVILSERGVASWNALLLAYVDQGEGKRALQLYIHMQEEGVSPDLQTYVVLFQACSVLAEEDEKNFIEVCHVKNVSLGIGRVLLNDVHIKGFACAQHLNNIILSVYCKCGAISEAEELFCQLPERNVVSWSTMISGYVEWGYGEKALQLYRQMESDAPGSSDELTFVTVIRACITIAEMKESPLIGQSAKLICQTIGYSLHADACRKGFISDVLVGSTLISMYSKCGAIIESQNMFTALSQPTNVSWNLLLFSYVEHGQVEMALLLYKKMHEEGYNPDQVTFMVALEACSVLGGKNIRGYNHMEPILLTIGKALHVDAEREGAASDPFVGSNLVCLYARHGLLADAEYVFSSLSVHIKSSWNAMFLAYLYQGFEEKLIPLYKQMREYHVTLDEVVLVSILQVCDVMGSLDMCARVHFDVTCVGYDQVPLIVASLVSAYGSCASMADAQSSFDRLSLPDIVSWNACISGYTRDGDVLTSLHMFEELRLVNILPNEVSLLAILSVCGHAGFVVQGLGYFTFLNRDYSVSLDVKHYGSILDLLARAGDFSRIRSLLKQIPMEVNQPIWLSLLAGCRTHCNLELAKRIFQNVVHVESSERILMSKIFADAQLQECCVPIDESLYSAQCHELNGVHQNQGNKINLSNLMDHVTQLGDV